MPWQCSACATEIEQDELVCPTCQAPKSSWSMVPDQTRTFVMAGRSFELLRRVDGQLVVADQAFAVRKRSAAQRAKAGEEPDPDWLLVVRLHPRKATDLSLDLGVVYEEDAVGEERVEVARPKDFDDTASLDVPLLLVYGEGDGPSPEGLAGAHLVDVTEEGELGHAPKLEVTALKRRARDVPVVAWQEGRRASLLEIEDVLFHHGSAVLLPGLRAQREEGDQLAGLAALRVAIGWAEDHPEQQLLVAGHTDRSGDEAFNLKLSRERADAVALFLRGEREDWVALADGRNVVEDAQAILSWARAARGWDCDPGEIDAELGPKTRAATEAFQTAYNQAHSKSIAVDGVFGPQTWGAVYDVYEHSLAQALGATDLSGARGQLRWLEPASVGCGEHHPVDAVRPDDERNAGDRRVELLFFEPGEAPALSGRGDEDCDACALYTGDYRFERIPAWLSDHVVRLRVLDSTGEELAGKRYELKVAGEVHGGHVPDDGVVEHAVPEHATTAELVVYPYGQQGLAMSWELELRALEPVEGLRGVQDRLRNLGYYAGEIDEDLGPLTRDALRAFQCASDLVADGEPTDETRAALRAAHQA